MKHLSPYHEKLARRTIDDIELNKNDIELIVPFFKHYGIEPSQVLNPCRKVEFVVARRLVWYFLVNVKKRGVYSISKSIGFDHSTVIKGIYNIQNDWNHKFKFYGKTPAKLFDELELYYMEQQTIFRDEYLFI